MHQTLTDIDVNGATTDEVADLVGAVRQVQRDCTALLVDLAQVAERHQAEGRGRPVADVLADQDSVTLATARADLDRSRMAARFPELGSAIRSGAARPENVDVLARTCRKMSEDEVAVLAEQDSVIADAAGRLSADSFRRKLHRLRDRIRDDHGQTAAEQATAETEARVSLNRDKNGYRIHATLDPLQGEAVQTAHRHAIRRLTDDLGAGHDLTPDQLAAQALTDLIVRGAATTPTEHNSRPAVHLTVLTDGTTLTSGPHDHTIAETGNGVPVSPDTIGRLACDCIIRKVETLPDGRVNVSRSSRTVTPAQRAALRALYPGCAISGAPWSHVEVHHVQFVEHGGETILVNLVPLSTRWHHLIHDEGWRLEMDADRTLRLYRPDGQLDRTLPPPTPVLFAQDTHQLVA